MFYNAYLLFQSIQFSCLNTLRSLLPQVSMIDGIRVRSPDGKVLPFSVEEICRPSSARSKYSISRPSTPRIDHTLQSTVTRPTLTPRNRPTSACTPEGNPIMKPLSERLGFLC